MAKAKPNPTPAENTSPLSASLEGRKPDPIPGDIDQRLANLLRDHQEMGARPKDGSTDTHEATYPLKAKSKK